MGVKDSRQTAVNLLWSAALFQCSKYIRRTEISQFLKKIVTNIVPDISVKYYFYYYSYLLCYNKLITYLLKSYINYKRKR